MNTQFANVAREEILFIMSHDFALYSSDRNRFVTDNYTAYDVALNTWLRMVDDSCGLRAVRSLKGNLLAQGLASTIKDCAIAADVLISESGAAIPDFCREMIVEDKQITLQCLRYLKRFTPVNPTLLYERSVEAFLTLNSSLKTPPTRILPSCRGSKDYLVLERSAVGPRWLLQAVKEKCHLIIGDYVLDDNLVGFSSGTTSDSGKILLDKLKAITHWTPSLFDSPLYPISKESKNLDPENASVEVVPVPKNYKTARVIAKLPAYYAYRQQAVRKSLERACARTRLGKLITLDDQTINQELARVGSVYNVYATIDLSSASDSISDPLARTVLPARVYADISATNPRWLSYRDRRVKRFMFQTSGNATTFIAETIIFLAIALVATEYVGLFTGITPLTPRAYGDDLICDVSVEETLTEFLEMLGFTVNRDKSFGSLSDYRESCGCEYYLGLDMHTRYYPRQPIGADDTTSLAALISLQHRIFSFTSAEAWLTSYLQRRFTKIGKKGLTLTSSPIGTECDDIWDYTPIYTVMNAPFDHSRMNDCDIKREAHLALVAKYPHQDLDEDDDELLTMYYYTKWLRDGAPIIDESDTFAGYIARCNHWTQTCIMRDADSGMPEFAWRLIKR